MSVVGRIALLVFVSLTAGCADAVSIVGSVARLRVLVQTEPGGSLLIRETYDLEADSSRSIAFRRRIARGRSDGVTLVSATPDSVADGDAGVLEAVPTTDGGVDVTWTTSGSARRQLTLTIRVASGVAVTEPRAGLTWSLVSAPRDHDIGVVEAELDLPAGSTIYPGTGIAEAGWNVSRTPAGIAASKAPVQAGESATLVAAFDFDRKAVPDPIWERNLDRQRQFLPAMAAAGLFFVVIGIGTLIIIRAQFPSERQIARTGRPGPSAADRQAAARGLVVAGMAGAGVAAASAVIAAEVLSFLGLWVQIIPASMLVVAAAFVLYAPRLRG